MVRVATRWDDRLTAIKQIAEAAHDATRAADTDADANANANANANAE